MTQQQPAPEPIWVISWSRCLYCGRKTPHEVCHEHSRDDFEPSEEQMAELEGWPNYDMEPEQCDLPDGHNR